MNNYYANNVKSAIALNPTFKAICDFNIKSYQQGWYEKHKSTIANGTGEIKTSEAGITYLASYGEMHQLKLDLAFETLFTKEDFNNKAIEVVDWGCGQALASGALIDYIKMKNIKVELSKFILIEPVNEMLQRGVEHLDAIYQGKSKKPQICSINEKADSNLLIKHLQNTNKIKIHLFSNVLDLNKLDLATVFKNVTDNFDGINYFVCVSPTRADKLQTFFKIFEHATLLSTSNSSVLTEIFRPTAMKRITKSISRVEYIFKTIL